MINTFTKYLQQKLKEELPGKKAHLEAAPYRKIEFSKAELLGAKKSSVLILFYPKNGQIYTVLMQRTTYNGKHSGQISFPGGKAEENDNSIYQTALRETKEEIGVDSKHIKIVGQMSDVFIPVSNFHVIPVLGVSVSEPNFVIETREVKSIIELNIQDLIQQKLVLNQVRLSNNNLIKVPSFEYDEKIIWGATALMLNELKYILNYWDF